jgi:hypothetical protein
MNNQLVQKSFESSGPMLRPAPGIAVPKKGPREDFRSFCAICHKKDESISELLSRLLKNNQTGERAFLELREKLSRDLRDRENQRDRRGGGR